MAIFNALVQSSKHPSAENVYQALTGDFPNLSFDTVYRTLNTFAEIGIAEVIEGYGRSRCFDPNTKQHHHLHCIKCGSIIDFYSDAYDNLKIPEHIHNKFEVHNKRVVINGICERCKSK
jgi:Fur family peroxide stress response transcriptional regulator